MTTKGDSFFFLKNNQQTFCHSSDSQYSNLNLNQTNKCSDLNSVQSNSKSINGSSSNEKHLSPTKNNTDTFKVGNYQNEKGASQSLNKSINNLQTKPFESLNLYDKTKNDSKKRQNKNSNNSTLSLHIAAYENSIEASNLKLKSNSVEGAKKNLKISSKFQDPFEIPRQNDSEIATPEIMQFKTSQRLFNPNDTSGVEYVNLKLELEKTMIALGLGDGIIPAVSAPNEKPNVHRSTAVSTTTYIGLNCTSLTLGVDDDSTSEVSTAIEQSNSDFNRSTILAATGFGGFNNNSTLLNLGADDDDGFCDIPTPKQPYVRPPHFRPTPQEPSIKFGGFQGFKKKSPFAFFTGNGSVSIDKPNGKPPLNPFKGRCYSTSGEVISGKNVDDSYNETSGINSTVASSDETFLSWSSRKSKSSKPATGEPSIAPIGYVPKVRALSKIYEDDIKSAKEYETIYDFDEPLIVHGISNLKTIDTWEMMGLPDVLLQNIKASMYSKPREVQRVSMPLILDNLDILVCSEAGSGKTAAFLIPIILSCMQHKSEGTFISEPSTPFAVVLGPTRELMHQNFEQALKFTKNTGVTVAKLYGEYAVRPNCRELWRGCDLLFTTPGRLHHFFKENLLCLKKIRYLVFDEGDTVLGKEFIDDIDPVIRHYNFARKKYYQTLFFSATFGEFMITAATRYMRRKNSASVLSKKCATNKLCLQEFQRVQKDDRLEKLKEFLDTKMLEVDMDSKKFPRILIFVNSQLLCDELTENLRGFGFAATRIRGNYAQNCRLSAFEAFRNKTIPIMVSTDVCARGIDIKDVDLVINYELPYYLDTYIYRVGRVGRIREGNCLSFVDPELNKFIILEILKVLQVANHPVSLEFDEIVEEAERLIAEEDDPANGFDVFFGDQTATNVFAERGIIPF